MDPSRRGAPAPTLLIVDAGPGAERLERHVVPWIASVARAHGTFDVGLAPAHVVLRADRPDREGNSAPWTAAVAAADAILFATSTTDTGLLELLLDLSGRRDRAWRLKPVAIAQPAGPAGDRVADLLEAAVRELHARPIDERLRWAAPADALRAGAETAEADARAAVLRTLDGLYRAHQTLRAFRPVESAVLVPRR
jgi:NAD(P)H-dependent FMN reductase